MRAGQYAHLVAAAVVDMADVADLVADAGEVGVEVDEGAKIVVEGVLDVRDGGGECDVCAALVLLRREG